MLPANRMSSAVLRKAPLLQRAVYQQRSHRHSAAGFSGAHLHHRLAVGLMAASIASEAQAATKRTLEVGRELQLQEGQRICYAVALLRHPVLLQFSAL